MSAQRRSQDQEVLTFRKILPMMLVLFLSIPLVVIDQLSKSFVLNQLQPGTSIPVIKGIFHISLVLNKGVAFGIFAQGLPASLIWIFIICALIILLIIFCWKNISPSRKSIRIFVSLILGGAIGNLIDRIRFGFVIDFLDFRIWPVFNIADSAITIGTALLILQLLRQKNSCKL